MIKIITVQPASYVDQMVSVRADDDSYVPDTDSNEILELTKKPYPFHVWEDGLVHRQEFWRGKPRYVVGFTQRLEGRTIDLWWRDAVKNPQQAIGMYLVTRNRDGKMFSHETAIESVEVHEVDPEMKAIDEAVTGDD